ncbi:mechanosensitive ion channel family protein [Leptolyngbya ohadii]|uniref:mechanosensitive ion channel family protein n=1 Tax=Leptolyngbya ohadii TaxID=1962290 RepID=UPI000B59B877|nr:mechanosensitive ion channel family protein [Leptolyngbya ohadii]
MDIVITLVGIAGIAVSFVLLNWLIAFGLKAIATVGFKQQSQKIASLQQNISVVFLVVCVLLCLAIGGINGVLIYQGKSVSTFYLTLLTSIPQQFWMQSAIAIIKCILLLLLVKLSLPYGLRLLDWLCGLTQNSDRITANDESVRVFFKTLKGITVKAIWLSALIACGSFLQLPNLIITSLIVLLRAYLAISVGRLVIKALSVLIDTLDALSLKYSSSENLLRHYDRFRHLVPALKKALEYILYVVIATLVIHDIDSLSWVTYYSDEIIQIIGIYFICGVLIEACNIILEDLVLQTHDLTDLQRQRRLTIIPLFKSLLKYLVYFTGAVLVLNLVGINPAPILAGAGIVGLAVGFGAQNLINDIVCGFFILFENYYLVGDYIEAGRGEDRIVEGVVEAIELRTTHIRHPDGQLQIIRNGEIGSIVNYSKQFAYARVDVPLPQNTKLEQAYHLIQQVGQQLQDECADVLEVTQIEGLENFDSESLVIRTMTRVKPSKHLSVQRLLRSKLKQAFDHHSLN